MLCRIRMRVIMVLKIWEWGKISRGFRIWIQRKYLLLSAYVFPVAVAGVFIHRKAMSGWSLLHRKSIRRKQ